MNVLIIWNLYVVTPPTTIGVTGASKEADITFGERVTAGDTTAVESTSPDEADLSVYRVKAVEVSAFVLKGLSIPVIEAVMVVPEGQDMEVQAFEMVTDAT